jgi:hypothetical protein
MGSPTVLIGNLMAARIGDPTVHGGVIVVGFPTVMIGDIGAGSPTTPGPGGATGAGSGAAGGPASAPPADSCPTSLPNTCPDAPKTVQLPNDINKEFQDSYKNSFPGGKSQEQGGTLVQDKNGKIKLVNMGAGTSGTFSPDRKVGAGEKIIGTFHTHPYDASEGGWKGVSFSGADIAYASYYKEPIYVDAGNKQFMIMPSKATPAGDISGDWDKEYAAQLAAGNDPPEASREATNKIAKKYKMAYYEGENGELTRVSC